ncbi:MAG: N-acetylmuramoyl-L-alanine amidase [Dehalococcoidia bacterium]|nr:N-acetylmuramoyl-L-alanine amidase [Dehalococcoidia bacterium]
MLVPIGGDQRATPAQLTALRSFVDRFRAALQIPVSAVVGHQELSPTSCPGTLMADFVLPYRRGDGGKMADGKWFPETGHFVGGGFWQFWSQFGGLAVFGLPLTDELEEDVPCSDPKCRRAGQKHVVQYFERAVFEWHPGVWPDRYDVLLRRIGAEVARAKGYQGPGI